MLIVDFKRVTIKGQTVLGSGQQRYPPITNHLWDPTVYFLSSYIICYFYVFIL
jgi:hypothetical protein